MCCELHMNVRDVPYVLHVPREALCCGRNGVLHPSQQIFLYFRRGGVFFGKQMSKAPNGGEKERLYYQI